MKNMVVRGTCLWSVALWLVSQPRPHLFAIKGKRKSYFLKIALGSRLCIYNCFGLFTSYEFNIIQMSSVVAPDWIDFDKVSATWKLICFKEFEHRIIGIGNFHSCGVMTGFCFYIFSDASLFVDLTWFFMLGLIWTIRFEIVIIVISVKIIVF